MSSRLSRRVQLPDRAGEGKTYTISGSFIGDLGDVPPLSALSSLTLTLWDDASRAILNNVDRVNILNTGRGTVDVNGYLICTLVGADNAVLDPQCIEELHVAFFEWTYSGGDKSGGIEVAYYVRNFAPR